MTFQVCPSAAPQRSAKAVSVPEERLPSPGIDEVDDILTNGSATKARTLPVELERDGHHRTRLLPVRLHVVPEVEARSDRQ